MPRQPGLSVRLRLTLSYVGFLMVAGALLLATVWVFLLRYVPDQSGFGPGPFSPTRGDLVDAFVPRAAQALGRAARHRGRRRAGSSPAACSRRWPASPTPPAWPPRARSRTGSGCEGRDDEFRELADAFDAMLARLEAQVAEQQRFAANASHELRTPLAITQTLLDVARRTRPTTTPSSSTASTTSTPAPSGLTEALLLLSRADQRTFARSPVDLSLLAEDAAETLLPQAERRGTAIETTGERGAHARVARRCCSS